MIQPSPAGGLGAPNGARGGALEANAFWQQFIENWLITWFIMRRLRIPRVMGYDIIWWVRVLIMLYCSWGRAHATTSRLPPDRENPKAALFCLANRCSRSKMTER